MSHSPEILNSESSRLFDKLHHIGWSSDECEVYAPMTLEINKLKAEQDAIILAHSYQSPDIVYGVSDFVGDSYALSKIAAEHKAKKIIFCSVYFMAETAKILSPDKEVLIPSYAGCSLADSITAENVRELKKKHPGISVVCYINTSAEVKAESDVCVTSSNVLQIIEALPGNKVIFIPDKYMADYIRRTIRKASSQSNPFSDSDHAANAEPVTGKEIIDWPGVCIVHEKFTADSIKAIHEEFPKTKILVHPECTASVIDQADYVGSTSQIIKYVEDSHDKQFMIVSECGLSDRIRTEHPEKEIVGTCALCPYMKSIQLKDVLQVLQKPRKDQTVIIEKTVLKKAKISLDRMFELTR